MSRNDLYTRLNELLLTNYFDEEFWGDRLVLPNVWNSKTRVNWKYVLGTRARNPLRTQLNADVETRALYGNW